MSLGAVLPSPTTKCPTCRGTRLRRSRWTRRDGALSLLLFSPYRCMACDKRFFRWSNAVVSLLRGGALTAMVMASIIGTIYLMNKDDKAPRSAPLFLAPAASDGGGPRPLATAVAGDAQLQFELGVRYLAGEGVAMDSAEALKWLEMAAGGGHTGARYDLGVMYKSGFGVQRNDALATQWFDLAARQNHAEAQYQMALMQKEGTGVPIDLVKSYTWAHIGAIQGHIGAIALRENLLQVMTPQQVKDGQRAARVWNAGTEKPAAPPRPEGAAAKG
jgi:TPR repeat protein